jgi:hypothetical protein
MTTRTGTGQRDGVHIACIDFVEMVTEYLDGALPREVAAAIDAHLLVCPGCLSVLDQFRTVIAQSGRLRVEAVDAVPAATREPLMAAFREWARSRPAG